MKIRCGNFRSISDAETHEARITCIMGKNQSGKTSLLTAVGAALIGDKKPYGVTQNNPWAVIQHNRRAAMVSLQFEGGAMTSISWPGEHIVSRMIPPANEITIGRVDPAYDYDAKQWAEFIRGLVGDKGKITGAMLKEALNAAPFADRDLVQDIIKEAPAGLDALQAQAKADALSERRLWQAKANQPFGEKKAATAHQQQHDMIGHQPSFEELEHEHELAKQWLDNARAIELNQDQNAEAVQEQMAALELAIVDYKQTIAAQEACIHVINQDYARLPLKRECIPCPHCGCGLAVVGETIEACEEITSTEEDLAKAKELDDRRAECEKTLNYARCDMAAKQARLSALQEIIQRLFALQAADGDPQARSVEELHILVQEKEGFITNRIRDEQCARHYELWAFHTAAEKILSPTGLRLTALQDALGEVQEMIDEISEYLFPGKRVVLELNAEQDGLNLMFNDMHYSTLTWNGDPNSYRLRIQYLFQIIQARILGPSTPVLLDRVDTLEIGLIGKLLSYLVDYNVHAVLGRTMPAKPDRDKLKAAGKGLTYWINEEGVLEAV